MVAVVAVIGNPKHAIDGTDRTADAGTHRAANHGPYRTSRTAALTRAFLRSANDALRMPELGDCQ